MHFHIYKLHNKNIRYLTCELKNKFKSFFGDFIKILKTFCNSKYGETFYTFYTKGLSHE